MDKNLNRSNYERRMHQVIQYIDENISQPINLEELAAVAHFSPYHFHRLFAAWANENLGDYIRRRRLELASIYLISQPHLTVLSIALFVGFGSAEAFSRSFKQHTGYSPIQWRQLKTAQYQNSNLNQPHRNPHHDEKTIHDQNKDSYNPPEKEYIMKVNIIQRDPVSVAYLRYTGPYGAAVGQFWAKTFMPWLKENGLCEKSTYGIGHDDPSITSPDQCRYDACVEVPPDQPLSGNPQRTTIPGGKYAVVEFKGKPDTIGDAWTDFFKNWLPSSGLQLDHRPCFEYYPSDMAYDSTTGKFTCQLCIPVNS